MLIKFESPDDFAETLKLSTRQNTASKAFQIAAAHYVQQLSEIARLRRKISDLDEECAVYRQTISGARDAAALLVERVSQSDMFLNRREKQYDIDAWNSDD